MLLCPVYTLTASSWNHQPPGDQVSSFLMELAPSMNWIHVLYLYYRGESNLPVSQRKVTDEYNENIGAGEMAQMAECKLFTLKAWVWFLYCVDSMLISNTLKVIPKNIARSNPWELCLPLKTPKQTNKPKKQMRILDACYIWISEPPQIRYSPKQVPTSVWNRFVLQNYLLFILHMNWTGHPYFSGKLSQGIFVH